MNHPTDPTPVRALIKADSGPNTVFSEKFCEEMAERAHAAIPSISQLLSEHDKVVEYIKELQFLSGTLPFAKQCHDRLQSIVEGK